MTNFHRNQKQNLTLDLSGCSVQIIRRLYFYPMPLTDVYWHFIQCESKKSALRISDIFSQTIGNYNKFLHTYYTFISTLDCKSIQLSPILTKLCQHFQHPTFPGWLSGLTSRFLTYCIKGALALFVLVSGYVC